MLPVKKIQNWLKKNSKDIFIINRTDEFLGEYIAPYAERLKWISNFSGSAGRAIIEQNKAYIFIDGRYTEQAQNEIDTTLFEIKKIQDYWIHLQKYNFKKSTIILDPLLHSIREVKKIKKIFLKSNITLDFPKKNPIDLIWNYKLHNNKNTAFIHEKKYAGESSQRKIKRIQKIIKSKSIDFYFLNSLDSIAWLLNIRGNDIKYTPLLFCYLIIPRQGRVELFIDKIKKKYLINYLGNTTNFNSFEKIDKYLLSIDIKKTIGMDENSTPYHFKNIINSLGLFNFHFNNPCLYPKAIKNKIEIQGAINANIRDGLSVTKFLYWLKNKIVVGEMNEIKAADYLFKLRKKNNLFHSLSFESISAFARNAAMPHYSVTKETNLSFYDNDIYLIDSGAQYKDGTTDITRTIIIGKPSDEQMDRYTRVLKGHIAIARITFPLKTKGFEIDPLARKSLQEINCDYNHGTGHGIGSFLSVHEGPQRISKFRSENDVAISEGMILSNEPGYYKKGEYGIRIENLIICRPKGKNKLCFETISWAPFDRDLIKISLLNKDEIKWIDNYHHNLYEKISPNLSVKEKKWLRSVTISLLK